jgi:hypothetical protein
MGSFELGLKYQLKTSFTGSHIFETEVSSDGSSND